MYLKFPNDFLIPVKSVKNLINDFSIRDFRADEENVVEKKEKEKEEVFIEEGLKDIENKRIWEKIDEEYSESQVSNK